MNPLARSLRRGDPLIWFTGSALGVCLLMIAGLVGVILVNGLGFFWPRPLLEVTLRDGGVFLGEVENREPIPNPGHPDHLKKSRIQLRVGNRDLLGFDFKWIDENEIARRPALPEAWFIERREYGPLIGTPVLLKEGEAVRARGPEAIGPLLPALLGKAERDRAAIARIEKGEIGEINYRIEQLRLLDRKLDFEARRDPALDQGRERDRIRRAVEEQQALYATKQEELGRIVELAAPATRLGFAGRLGIYTHRLWEFLRDDPRESNTEGGIFPAIFGTVMMVVIMSIIGVALGVLAALYVREYAKQGALVRIVRIAVNNLAGVPSIVFGVFGLGFFVYFVGGTIDQLFFSAALPTPTYGTGGILWASLTLALLTVPVVIVASEEALAAVPRSMREASLAAGASKWQTIQRVVLPAAAPGILTGLILAMARGAGEVAPLMLVGVVKLAPTLPLDGFFPFVHLDRKFMHLGFHIYDLGFQSPDSDAAKPMVFATTLLLITLIVLLNVGAIWMRDRLRKKYATGAF